MTYIKINEYLKAKSDCQAAILIDNKFSKAHYHLSKCYMV